MLIGLLYGFIFWKIGEWAAQKYALSTAARIGICIAIFFLTFCFHLIAMIAVVGGEVRPGGIAPFMGAAGFFYGTRKKSAE